MLKLAISGASGRMGRKIAALAVESGDFEIVAALEAPGNDMIGSDIGTLAGIGEVGVVVSADIAAGPDVIIDFSLPDGTRRCIEYCSENPVPLVVGTTGLGEDQMAQLAELSGKMPVLAGANMSMGVNLLFRLAAEVAMKLDDDYDIEIIEAHHRFKRDAPSGTALELGRQIAAAKGWPWPGCATHGRQGDSLRQDKTIGMHAVRAGDIVGEHQVIYSAEGETVELRHRAGSRDTFVRGAIKAAKWLASQEPGMYNMFNVLGL